MSHTDSTSPINTIIIKIILHTYLERTVSRQLRYFFNTTTETTDARSKSRDKACFGYALREGGRPKVNREQLFCWPLERNRGKHKISVSVNNCLQWCDFHRKIFGHGEKALILQSQLVLVVSLRKRNRFELRRECSENLQHYPVL